MQFILSSRFVSLASSVNIAIIASLSVMGCPFLAAIFPRIWMLQITASVCGILFNSYVLLESKRKLGFLTKAMKKLQLYLQAVKQVIIGVYYYIENLTASLERTTSLEFFCRQIRIDGLMTYLKQLYTTKLVDSKVVKDFHTPELIPTQAAKTIKSRSDPLKRTDKLCIKAKYLPANSPELFKNRIYLTRRNLTNALDD